MKRILYAGPFVAALLCPAPAASGGWFHRGGCESCAAACADCAGPAADQVYLKATITEQKYTQKLPPVVPGAGAKVTTATADVPCTKLVEVDVRDPHTGCVTRQLKPQAVVENLSVTSLFLHRTGLFLTPAPPRTPDDLLEIRWFLSSRERSAAVAGGALNR